MTMSNDQAFVIDKNLGARLNEDDVDMPVANSDGLPVVPLTAEQKYLFDMRGWLLVPGVLSEADCTEMKEFSQQLHDDPESLAEHERSAVAGPLQKLTDHPNVVGFMNEFVAYPGLSNQECYGFRQESGSLFYRDVGDGNFAPHNGNGMFRFPGDSHLYRCIPGKANSGLTRVVWELNPITEGNGTLLVTGSHKAVYPAPEGLKSPDSPIWETYTCPPGSLLFFTEALTHSARPWGNTEYPRIAIFSCYNTVNSKWHNWNPHPDLVASMPAKRQTLYRPVHVSGNLVGGEIH
jgi:hypothetical protein